MSIVYILSGPLWYTLTEKSDSGHAFLKKFIFSTQLYCLIKINKNAIVWFMTIETDKIIEWLGYIWNWAYTRDIILAIPVLGVVIWEYKRARRLYKNLQRPIFLFEMKKDNLERVQEVLKETQLNPLHPKTDISSLDSLTSKYSACIVGYTDGHRSADILRDIIGRIRHYHIPLVIYTDIQIPPGPLSIIRNYSYSEVCNSPLRVVTLVNSIGQTFPYEKR